MDKIVIFDLDGTLALIDKRRAISTKDNGKMDWDKFFDPMNIALDQPNTPVIKMAQLLKSQGFMIVIFYLLISIMEQFHSHLTVMN